MSKEAMVEEQMLLGLDDRTAEAIADENAGLQSEAKVLARIELAQELNAA
jgi:hypothetical protein